MKKYYVIGDIHGRIDLLTIALREWDRGCEQLVFLGNYIDYGPNSREVMREIKSLKKRYGAITLAGKHDVNFYQLMTRKKHSNLNTKELMLDGRTNTLLSLLGTDYSPEIGEKKTVKLMNDKNLSLIEFLGELNTYYETEHFIFANSGVDLMKSNWRDSDVEKFYNSDSSFIRNTNKTGRIIVFGHFRTGIIRGMNKGKNKSVLQSMAFLDDRYWISQDGTKLGLNGGPSFNGNLLAAKLNGTSDRGEIITVDQNLKKKREIITINREFNKIK